MSDDDADRTARARGAGFTSDGDEAEHLVSLGDVAGDRVGAVGPLPGGGPAISGAADDETNAPAAS